MAYELPGGIQLINETPKAICDTLKVIRDTKTRLVKTAREIKGKVSKVQEIACQFLFGLKALTISEGLAVVNMMARQLMDNLLTGPLSAMAAAYIKVLLSSFLELLMNVNVVYALVAIPLNRAKLHTRTEFENLIKAQAQLNVIMAIVYKWLGKLRRVDCCKYHYGLDKDLERLLEYLNAIFEESADGYKGKQVFLNQDAYNSARKQIAAIRKKTVVDGSIFKVAEAQKAAKNKQNAVMAEERANVDAWYNREKKKLSTQYAIDMGAPDRVEGTVTSLLYDGGETKNSAIAEVLAGPKVAFAKARYRASLDALNADRERAMAGITAKYSIVEIGEAFSSMFGPSDFKSDMEMLGDSLEEFIRSWNLAQGEYVLSQMMTAATYDFGNILRRFMDDILRILQGVGDVASKPAVLAVNGAIGLTNKSLELTREAKAACGTENESYGGIPDFSVKKYSKLHRNGKGESGTRSAKNVRVQAKASMSLTGIEFMMASADALLGATISEELIAIINLDDNVRAGDEEFQKFRGTLAAIPDWDGRAEIWAVFPYKASLPPYIAAIEDVARMTVDIPESALNIGAFQGDLGEITTRMDSLNEKIESMIKHNRKVTLALKSYTPITHPAADKLEELLKAFDVIDKFAAGVFGLASLIKTIAEMAAPGKFVWKHCPDDTPSEEEIIQEKINAVNILELANAQQFVEETEYERAELRVRLGRTKTPSSAEDLTNLPKGKY